jgi:uncharacterized protein YgfB (UPF0149 family)
MSYKQTVLDIKDYISFETAQIEHLLDGVGLVQSKKTALQAEKEALKDILDIIKENGQ